MRWPWLAQSVNQAALKRLHQISAEMLLAEHLNAMYMTDSAFEARICALPVEPPVSSDGRANAVNFLRANMPEMKRATPETVAAIRRDRPELFERFQRTLVFRQSSIDRFLKLEVLGIQEIPASAARQLKMDGTLVDISSESSGAEGDVKDRAQRIYTRDVEPQVKDLQLACDKMIYSTVGNFVLVGGATFGLALFSRANPCPRARHGLRCAHGRRLRNAQRPRLLKQAQVPNIHLVQASPEPRVTHRS